MANLTGPLLLIQGDADNEVAFSESVGLVRLARKLGYDKLQTKIFPDETHGLAKYSSQLEAAETITDFLRQNLA